MGRKQSRTFADAVNAQLQPLQTRSMTNFMPASASSSERDVAVEVAKDPAFATALLLGVAGLATQTIVVN